MARFYNKNYFFSDVKTLFFSGGGLGGTRRGGPDVNTRHSGREDRDRDRDERSTSRRRSRSRDRSRERRRRRSRSKDRKRTRRSRSRDRFYKFRFGRITFRAILCTKTKDVNFIQYYLH
jgi:hypothetical protein